MIFPCVQISSQMTPVFTHEFIILLSLVTVGQCSILLCFSGHCRTVQHFTLFLWSLSDSATFYFVSLVTVGQCNIFCSLPILSTVSFQHSMYFFLEDVPFCLLN